MREVIWVRPERAGKGPAPTLTRTQIAEAATVIADARGVEGVSMRNVASSVGVGTASLYRYVDSKDELLDLMIDWVEGEDGAPPSTTGRWREDVTAYAVRTRRLFLKHPWLTEVAAARAAFGPWSLAWTEHGLSTLDPLDLDADRLLIASETVTAFVRGFVARELADAGTARRDPDRLTSAIAPYIRDIVAGGDHPRFSAIVRDAALPHEHSRDALFDAALARILDSIAEVA